MTAELDLEAGEGKGGGQHLGGERAQGPRAERGHIRDPEAGQHMKRVHVPVDDETCYWYSMFTSFDKPVDKALMREQRLKEHRLPDYAPIKNKRNNYGFDPREQATATYTGMGMDINVHDQWAVEGMGAIQDRTQEHLGRSDVAIIRYRRKLRQAIKDVSEARYDALPMQGADLSELVGPLSNDAIAETANWKEASQAADMARRADCPWDATV